MPLMMFCIYWNLKLPSILNLKEHGLSDWVAQENAVFDKLDYSNEDHNNLIKEKDKNDMSMFEWHVYCGLMEFLDSVAKKYNKPVYQLVNKKLVEALATGSKKLMSGSKQKEYLDSLKMMTFSNN